MDPVDLGEMELGDQLAVKVNGAYKRYTSFSVVLQGLNMNVREGTIYALLGPSGCGKTTLLRCMMGRTRLDAGEILVKAKRLRNVGYMPQELALHGDMSIAETFNFYGRIFGMSWGQIESRGIDLLKFLGLPKESSLVGNLSGGQQRRVSLAVALLHDPQLFILDEPTVGVDPVLSHSIWQRLIEMTEMHKKTIIITTHYIEEARQAHTIGLMRNGVLLAEEAPLDLMYHQNCSTLEDAFLKLSRRQENTQCDYDSSQAELPYPNPDVEPQRPLESGNIWCRKRFLAQLVKNFVFNMRNIPMLFFILFLPAIQAYLANSILGGEPSSLKLGVVSSELPNGFSDCDVYTNLTCSKEGRPLSCKYMDHLRRRTLILNEYQDVEDGRDAVIKGQIWGLLHFSENYTTSVFDRINLGQSAQSDIVDWANVDIWMDNSNLWIGLILKRDLIYGLVDYFKELFVECDSSPELADIPLKFEDPIYGLRSPKFIHYASSGLIITFCFYLPIMFTTGAIMMEKSVGLLERSLSAGMTGLEVVAAHAVVQFIFLGCQNVIIILYFYVIYYDPLFGGLTLILILFAGMTGLEVVAAHAVVQFIFLGCQNVIIILYFYVIYYNPLFGSLTLILILLFMVEFAGMCYALLLSCYFESEKLATYAGVGTIVIMFVMCGVVWPYQGMHWTLQSVVWLVPIQPAVEAYRGIAERSWWIDHHVVYNGFFSTFIWICIFTLSAYVIARKKKIGL